MKTGIELITQERKEQIEKHGRSIQSDIDTNNFGQLAWAASWLTSRYLKDRGVKYTAPTGWDLQAWQKIHDKPYKERLIIAGALIAAEIDRIQNYKIKGFID